MTAQSTPPAPVYAGDDHVLYLDEQQVHVRLPDNPLEHLPPEHEDAQAVYRRHVDPLVARSTAQRANELLAELDGAGTTTADRVLAGCIAHLAEEDLSDRSGRQEIMTPDESYLVDWDRRTLSTAENTHALLAVHHLLPGQEGLVSTGDLAGSGSPTHRRLGLILRIQDLSQTG